MNIVITLKDKTFRKKLKSGLPKCSGHKFGTTYNEMGQCNKCYKYKKGLNIWLELEEYE